MLPNIELLKPRDFGEIINDTFIFVRQNIKPLFKYFFIFCGFFLVAIAATSILQQIKVASVVTNVTSNDFSDSTSRFAFLGIEFVLNMIFIVMGYTALTVMVLCYVTLYRQKGNKIPETDEMWGYFKFYYFKVLLYSVLMGILLIAATVCCIIPGVYLYPIFALVLPVMIIENTTFGYAFNHSFRLIKENWWVTFGSLVITIIIVYVASMIILIPATIMNLSSLIFHTQKNSKITMAGIVVGSVLQQAAQLLYILPIITASLCYFNLTESKEGTGLMERINKLGNIEPDSDSITEEY